MQRIANPVIEVLDILRARKRITLPVLSYRLGLPQKQVQEILDTLEQEKAITRTEEQGETVIEVCAPN